MTAEQQKTAICTDCGCSYSYTPILLFGQEVFENGLCLSCDQKRVDAARADHLHRERMRRHIDWDNMDLPWKDTVPAQLPHPRGRAVASWPYSYNAPFCHGPTHTGKSRSLILLCKRLWIEEGKDFRWVKWTSWCNALDSASRYGQNSPGIRREIELLSKWSFVVFDDVGKGKPRELFVTALDEVVATRSGMGKPTAISTTYELARKVDAAGKAVPSDFEKRMAVGEPKAARSLCQRLMETSRNYPFL